MADRSFYQLWYNIVRRCRDVENPNYKRYGARGIKLCSRWKKFINFRADMLQTYKKGLQIERVNNNGDYSPKNCRWATIREQANNRRDTRLVVYNGITQTLSYWAEQLNIKFSTLRQRFYVYKWDVGRCLNYGRKVGY